MDFTPRERTKLRAANLVVFEDRIIRGARKPITDAALAKIAKQCSGPVPKGLVALWRTTFGGVVDYDLTADFDGTIAHCSFRELFYPNSTGYRDLWGWIEHELELADKPKLDYLPFGGFEYPSRMYVRVAKGAGHGEVLAWEQGLPPAWRLRLHADATATIGPDVAALFRALAFHADPRAEGAEDSSATDLVAEIRALSDKALADKLLAMVGRAVLDWRAALAANTIAKDARLARTALLAVLAKDELPTLEALAAAGVDLEAQVTGGGAAIDVALAHDAKRCVRWLVDRGVAVTNALNAGANHASDALVDELLRRGARPDALAAVAAARAKRGDAALAIARAHVANGGDAAALAELARTHAGYCKDSDPKAATALRKLAKQIA